MSDSGFGIGSITGTGEQHVSCVDLKVRRQCVAVQVVTVVQNLFHWQQQVVSGSALQGMPGREEIGV